MKITGVTPYVVDPGYGKNWLLVKGETSADPGRAFTRPSAWCTVARLREDTP